MSKKHFQSLWSYGNPCLINIEISPIIIYFSIKYLGVCMSAIRDKFFWRSYGKFFVVAVIGFGVTPFIGLSLQTSVELTAGAILSFPTAYALIVKKDGEGNSSRPGSTATGKW
ncbi:hypothetical protein [Oceanibaculum sp.]|uniref:hypothetical protein n=1 Tax=Oceanibaculum sp. TaxID=1903597 RepID=UPI0025850625|nr:hypothetical protein [Oceanibaculum sp.]MCH2395197.1 hypothetical protein [Oceanibaculum sp.]